MAISKTRILKCYLIKKELITAAINPRGVSGQINLQKLKIEKDIDLFRSPPQNSRQNLSNC